MSCFSLSPSGRISLIGLGDDPEGRVVALAAAGEELAHAVRVVLFPEDAQPVQHVDQAAGAAVGARFAQVFDLHAFGNRHRLDVLARLLQHASAIPHGLGRHAEGLGQLERLVGRHLGIAVRPFPDDVEPAFRVDVAPSALSS